MISEALHKVMNSESGRVYGLVGHPHLAIWVQNLGDRPGLLIEVSLPQGVVIEDGQGFDIGEVSQGDKKFLLIRPTSPGPSSPAFVGLVEFVFRETASARSKVDSVNALLESVYEFRRFFARRPERLGESAVRGLFSELKLLLSLLELSLSPSDALAAWSGPFGATDFQFVGSQSIEVKSSHTSVGAVRIASEFQLVVPDGGLHLFVLPLTRVDPRDSDGETLVAMVNRLQEMMSGQPNSKRLWEHATQAIGFNPSDTYYEQWRFVSESWSAFSVNEHFPSLTPTDLPIGLRSVSYLLTLKDIDSFSVDVNDVLSDLVKRYE